MISSTDVILYKKKGFDGEKYVLQQKEAIRQRLSSLGEGRLYLEIAGKFLYDAHAARVLPGFIPESKRYIFLDFKDSLEILFCVHADDILNNPDYKTHVQNVVRRIEIEMGIKPHIVINAIDIHSNIDKILDFEQDFQRRNYRTWERYKISGYPYAIKNVLGDDGFGNDDHIPLTKKLVLLVSSSSGTGKTSTCLGQIYNDAQIDITSEYATYSLFPDAHLSSSHPLNLAYSSSTLDEDPTLQDQEYVDALVTLLHKSVEKKSAMNSYSSLEQSNISVFHDCIVSDELCSIASYQEIKRRITWYEKHPSFVEKSHDLLSQAENYIKTMGYSLDQKLF